MEFAVLNGARRVLQSRPVIFCEVNEDRDRVGNLLREASYDFFAARESDRKPLRIPSRDTLAISQRSDSRVTPS